MGNENIENKENNESNENKLRNMQELQDLRRAYLNILNDMEKKNKELEEGQQAFKNIFEDMELKNRELDLEKMYAENIINSISEMLFILDNNGTIKRANTAVLIFLGYVEMDEIIGKHINNFIEQEDEQKLLGISGLQFMGQIELTFVTKTKKRYHTLCSYSTINLINDDNLGILCAKDITDRKKIEEEIKEDLKDATTNLIQSEKLNALGELTASIAHELKQPLNIIKIITQSFEMDLKKNRLKDDELKNGLVDIRKQIDRMSEIIEHMRIFTRRSTSEKEEKNINEIVEVTCKFFFQQMKAHNIDLTTNLQNNLPNTKVDPIQIEQVIINLLNNAKDAFEGINKDDARIEIKTYSGNKSANNDYINIEIIDNAGGIPEDVAKKIFDPFFTTKAPGKGTGLGLSISKKIIENHQGKIDLKTEVNGVNSGTHFIISLPTIDQLNKKKLVTIINEGGNKNE
ncbi:MAG: PAS domain S-box protein [Oligoflexia bacterium]|nr:PAS domain S-box protein [Oligoflexia bacterium]